MNREGHPADSPILTIEEFERLPSDGWRTELVRGRVIREPPAGFEHGRLAARIGYLLSAFVLERGLGEILTADPGFVLYDDPPTVRAPDVSFVAADRLPAETRGFGRLAPDLAVGIVSPSNTPSGLQQKVLDYLDAGCRLVWVVDPEARCITVYRSRKEIRILVEYDELDGEEVLPGFRVRLADIFVHPR